MKISSLFSEYFSYGYLVSHRHNSLLIVRFIGFDVTSCILMPHKYLLIDKHLVYCFYISKLSAIYKIVVCVCTSRNIGRIIIL